MLNNRIKEARMAYVAAKEAEQKEAEKKARLDAIKEVDIVETMDEVTGNIAHTYRSESGVALGTNGGKLYQEPIKTPSGALSTIAANSKEELEELKAKIEAGMQGDGKYHKLITIGGKACDCVGSTLQELEEDIQAAEEYYVKHGGRVIGDLDVAEQLVDAGYTKPEIKQITGSDNQPYILSYNGSYIMDTLGRTIASLDDIESKLTKEDTEKLLTERLEAYIKEEADRCREEWEEEDEDYPDDDYDDSYDDDDDNGYGGYFLFIR